MVPIAYYLILASILFVIGVLGIILRRNALVMFMSLELMFNSANLLFVAYSVYYTNLTGKPIMTGQVMVIFIMVVAAAEVAVGLALMTAIFRSKKSVDVDVLHNLKG